MAQPRVLPQLLLEVIDLLELRDDALIIDLSLHGFDRKPRASRRVCAPAQEPARDSARPYETGLTNPRRGGSTLRPERHPLSIETQDVDLDGVDEDDVICLSTKALGNGYIEDICDIVYVRHDAFQRSKAVDVAAEISAINSRLVAEDRPYMLIGPGRWGSADRWLGIPVSWKQISGVRCVVETDMNDIQVTPSQGSHFFQNITSFRIGYFTVNSFSKLGHLDWDWLLKQESVEELEFTRHLFFEKPMSVRINGRLNKGIILKPGR